MASEQFLLGLRFGEDNLVYAGAKLRNNEVLENSYTQDEAVRVACSFLQSARDAHSGYPRDTLTDIGHELHPSMIKVGDADSEGVVVVAYFGQSAIHFRVAPYVAYELAEKAKAGENIKKKAPWEMELGTE